MSYQALYRKYRPTTFEEVCGQDVIKTTLENTLKSGKISHAYLFSGPRGTGKTTIAKIMARHINCLEPVNGQACNKCDNCIASQLKDCPDIIEIDAASNNGVDEIRELKNKINLVPTELKYKIYIIDEVHMLSIGAFNALLKTLEEPPQHVIFILATTDLHKVPITIVSRCQCFQFKKMNVENTIKRLKDIATLEKIEVDESVLKEIAIYADGGMRDAIGILDKLNSYSNGKITMEDLVLVNGMVSKKEIEIFVEKIIEKDVVYLLDKIDEYNSNGKDLIVFIEEIIQIIRNKIVNNYLENKSEYFSKYKKIIYTLNNLLPELSNTNNQKILFDIAIIELTISEEPKKNDELLDIKKIEQDIEADKQKLTINQNIREQKEIISREIISIEQKFDKKTIFDLELRINNTLALAEKAELLEIRKIWNLLVDYTLDTKYGAISCFLIDTHPIVASSKNILIECDYDSLVERGNSMINKIEEFLLEMFHKDQKVAFITKEKWMEVKNKYIKDKNNGVLYKYTEEIQNKEKADETENSNEKKILENNNELEIVRTAVALFGEEIVEIN